MSDKAVPVLTIDGPAGTGKGTIARQMAEILGYHYLDSGALYRILAYSSQQKKLDTDNTDALIALCQSLQIRFEVISLSENVRVFVDQIDVSDQLRTEECATRASMLAAIPEVRSALLEKQHAFRVMPGLVAEGRDMGTVVFPDALCKIYLTASTQERALRRQKQLMKQGISASLDHLLKEIEARDSRDENRAISPLRPAADAVLVDSTDLSIEEVVQCVVAIINAEET